jgi:hypothetical protein
LYASGATHSKSGWNRVGLKLGMGAGGGENEGNYSELGLAELRDWLVGRFEGLLVLVGDVWGFGQKRRGQ